MGYQGSTGAASNSGRIMIPFASEQEGYDVISTGLPQLDRITGIGGIPFKKITEISGPASVGKTSLAYSIVASAQQEGRPVIWIDAEWSWDGQYANKLGVDLKKLMLLQTRAAEDSLNELLMYVEKGKNTLIVIDAVGALHSRDEAEKDAEERTIGAQSALIARFCRKIVPMLSLNNNALIVLNHEYTPIETNGGRPSVKTSGGKKLEYHKSLWIRLSRTGVGLSGGKDENDENIWMGYKVQAEIKKNKCAMTERKKCEMEFLYGRGFSAKSDIVKDALDKGVLIKERANYLLRGEKIAYGQKALRAWLERPENESILQAALRG